MSVCPNCGAAGNGEKFCVNCGTLLPVEEQAQPVRQAQPQPAPAPAPSQPQAIPVQPVYDQPGQAYQPAPAPGYAQQTNGYQPAPAPGYAQPGWQQPNQGYQQPDYMQQGMGYQPQPGMGYQQQPGMGYQGYQPQMQSSYVPEPKKSTNGACIAGFILGLVGIFTFAIPSFIGFIVSLIGVIVASVKKQKGKVLGIIGMVLSLLMMVGMILFMANADKISEALDSNAEGQSFEEMLFNDSYEGKIEIISETEWLEKNSGSCLIFEADDNFKYYQDYRDLTNNYYTGTYEIYFGYEAMDVIEQRYAQYGYTSDSLCDKVEGERGVSGVKDFMVLVIHNDGCWIDGVNTIDLKWDNVYMGYYDANKNTMDLEFLESGLNYKFIPHS